MSLYDIPEWIQNEPPLPPNTPEWLQGSDADPSVEEIVERWNRETPGEDTNGDGISSSSGTWVVAHSSSIDAQLAEGGGGGLEIGTNIPKPWTNPPFGDWPSFAPPYPGMRKVTRGYMSVNYGSTRIKLNFLFNPDSISLSYAAGDDIPVMNLSSEEQSGVIYRNGATFSFGLLFDRHGPDGVLNDIRVWEKLVGVYEAGNIMSQTVTAQLGTYFHFKGDLTSASVSYTMFDKNMTPTRAEIQVSLRILFSSGEANMFDAPSAAPSNAGNTGGGGGGDSTAADAWDLITGGRGSKGPDSVSTGSGRIE